jgi:hypothetical protein
MIPPYFFLSFLRAQLPENFTINPAASHQGDPYERDKTERQFDVNTD